MTCEDHRQMTQSARYLSVAVLALTVSVAMNAIARAETAVPVKIAAMTGEAPGTVKIAAAASTTLEEKAANGVMNVTPPLATTIQGAAPATPPCSAPAELAKLGQPLTRTARLLAGGLPIKIVAMGSSSTAGAGASSEAASYPSRLAVELTERFPGHQFTVLNRGVNGEETADMMARFDSNIIAEKPDLVLWQVGTNAVLRDRALSPASMLIHEGVARLKATGADVVLIDPQFAPKVIAKHDAEGMVNVLASTAKEYGVGLFRRFAVMRHWRESKGMAFEAFVSPDQLHMNDWSYACVAKVLSVAIAEAATRPTASAAAQAPR
jgi:hypothetical protein